MTFKVGDYVVIPPGVERHAMERNVTTGVVIRVSEAVPPGSDAQALVHWGGGKVYLYNIRPSELVHASVVDAVVAQERFEREAPRVIASEPRLRTRW